MFDAETIAIIHREVGDVYRRALVLLGGTYLFGGAGAGSDLDFYVLGGWRDFWRYRRRKELAAGIKQKWPAVKIALIPKIFFRRGWYYIYGRDLNGKIHVSPINRKIIFRTTIKLDYLDWLKSLLAADAEARRAAVAKCARRAAVALMLLNNDFPSGQPLMAPETVRGYLLNRNDIASVNLRALMDGGIGAERAGKTLLDILEEITARGKKWWRFSIVNYLIYNLKFLSRGNGRFIFSNPDKKILGFLRRVIEDGREREKFYQEAKEIVFPIIVL